MADQAAKDALYDGLVAVAKALGNGRRAEIVDVLAQGERSVEELAGEIGQTLANTSQHLQQLLRAGLVRTRRDGTRIHYSLTSPKVGELWAAVRDVAGSQLVELDDLTKAYLGDRSSLDSITREELAGRLHDGDVIVLDVRPEAEYRAGHITGAVSLPVKEITRRLRTIPTDREIVAYCRGPYCVYADDAVRVLRRRGFQAARLDDGYPEWVRAGLPVESDLASTDGHIQDTS